jgi:hypothetical protein
MGSMIENADLEHPVIDPQGFQIVWVSCKQPVDGNDAIANLH